MDKICTSANRGSIVDCKQEKRALETVPSEGVKTMKENYIFPFLWLRGESEEVLRTEMEKIDHANIGAVCVEARPHPDFGGPQWWHDMDIILEEAKLWRH